MGDLGYVDDLGRLWFCGRKAHRVMTAAGPLDTIPCEAVFNTHPDVNRTALVGVGEPGQARLVLCVELIRAASRNKREWLEARIREQGKSVRDRVRHELLELGAKFPHTRSIRTILFHRAFPVDVRHNAKIFRERLAVWAARRVR
jgi:acyl-coenzyme A synthetase/AMP-(fatty) acid ligase